MYLFLTQDLQHPPSQARKNTRGPPPPAHLRLLPLTAPEGHPFRQKPVLRPPLQPAAHGNHSGQPQVPQQTRKSQTLHPARPHSGRSISRQAPGKRPEHRRDAEKRNEQRQQAEEAGGGRHSEIEHSAVHANAVSVLHAEQGPADEGLRQIPANQEQDQSLRHSPEQSHPQVPPSQHRSEQFVEGSGGLASHYRARDILKNRVDNRALPAA